MVTWQNQEAEAAAQGKSNTNWAGNKLVIDSRLVEKGDIFIALKGELNDGHEFLEQAFANGAAAAIIHDEAIFLKNTSPLMLVSDTTLALNNLAIYNRQRSSAKIISITGSVGKTSTRILTDIVLSAYGISFASRENYNNHVGHPINLASMPQNANFGVFEMGMNKHGEIEYLAKMTHADLVVITNIHPTHIEYFESLQTIADAKSEIFTSPNQHPIAVLNREDEFFDYLTQKAIKLGFKIVSFGKNGDCFIKHISTNEHISTVSISIFGQEYSYLFSSDAQHQIFNSLTALTVAAALGLDPEKALKKLEDFEIPQGRGNKFIVNIHGKTVTIIDDSYNCSPKALEVSLTYFKNIKGRRKLVVLGDMGELGENSLQYHLNAKDQIINSKADKFIAIGSKMCQLYETMPASLKLASFKNADSAMQEILNYVEDGDQILFKSSKSTGLTKIVNYIQCQAN